MKKPLALITALTASLALVSLGATPTLADDGNTISLENQDDGTTLLTANTSLLVFPPDYGSYCSDSEPWADATITNSAGVTIFDSWLESKDCSSSTFTRTVGSPLPNGQYTIHVTASTEGFYYCSIHLENGCDWITPESIDKTYKVDWKGAVVTATPYLFVVTRSHTSKVKVTKTKAVKVTAKYKNVKKTVTTNVTASATKTVTAKGTGKSYIEDTANSKASTAATNSAHAKAKSSATTAATKSLKAKVTKATKSAKAKAYKLAKQAWKKKHHKR